MALTYRIKARAKREIEKAAEWWAENRLAAPVWHSSREHGPSV